MEQAFFNGAWHDVRKAFLQSLLMFNSANGYNSDVFGAIDLSYEGSGSSGSVTIGEQNIQYNNSYYVEYNGNHDYIAVFKPHEFIDITRYSKVHIKGTLTQTGNAFTQYIGAVFTIRIEDENGNRTVLWSGQNQAYNNSPIDLELDLTQYTGNYKLVFLFDIFGRGGAQGQISQTLKVSECYFD